jgi:hypothetical protein
MILMAELSDAHLGAALATGHESTEPKHRLAGTG